MGALFAGTFWIIGIPYGVVIGIFSGFSNLIPYFGAAVAFLLAVLSGLFSSEPMRAVYAAIAILLLQQLDSAVIVPRVVGSRVELHPVLVLLSLAVFGGFFGFWGLLFAVPLGALLKNFFFRLYEQKAIKTKGKLIFCAKITFLYDVPMVQYLESQNKITRRYGFGYRKVESI